MLSTENKRRIDPNPSAELDFVLALQMRDESAFELLYDRYGQALMSMIRRTIRDHSDAENLLQETFVKVWRNIAQFDATRGRLFTWMVAIVRNTVLDFLRTKQAAAFRRTQSLDDTTPRAELHLEPADISHIGISETVQRLDPKLQEVIHMIYFLGYTQQEVADELQLPLGTVKTRTRSALLRLRAYFE